MAPNNSQVWVLCEKTDSGSMEPFEAYTTKDAALAAASQLVSATEIKGLDLKKGAESNDKGSQTKTQKKAGKRTAADDGDEDELAAGKEATPEPSMFVENGMPGAMQGVKLLFTGTMNMNRKQCEEIAKNYGATVVKKLEDTDYIVLGTKPGPKKVEEIEEKNLDTLTEADFFDMLTTGVPDEKRARMEAARMEAARMQESNEPPKKKAKK